MKLQNVFSSTERYLPSTTRRERIGPHHQGRHRQIRPSRHRHRLDRQEPLLLKRIPPRDLHRSLMDGRHKQEGHLQIHQRQSKRIGRQSHQEVLVLDRLICCRSVPY